jgi:peptidoglycan hydrolase CwlO-like protein
MHKKEKKEVMNKIDRLDKKAETTMSTPQEVDFKHCLKGSTNQFIKG